MLTISYVGAKAHFQGFTIKVSPTVHGISMYSMDFPSEKFV